MKKTILIIRFGSLGDILLTSPTVLNLRSNFPDAKILYLTKEKYRSTVALLDGIDEILTIDNNISTASYFNFLIHLDRNYDYIFDLHGNFRSWMARKILTANHKYVYPKRRLERALIVKNKIYPESFPHTIDLYNQTVIEAGLSVYLHRPVVKTSESTNISFKEFLNSHKSVVVVAPGASYKTKQYPPEKFASVALSLHKQNHSAIIWADAHENDELPAILQHISAESFMRVSNLPIGELASLIDSAQLTIANDSGIAHLSSAVNTPVITIFGPTHTTLGFAPHGLFDQVVQVPEKCRPCSLHGGKPCYRESQYCFDNIEPERITKLALHKLNNDLMFEKAVFLDRDGTIIVDKDYLADPFEIELIAGTVAALQKLQSHGYKLIVVSNQSGVARGKFTTDSVENVNRSLSELLAQKNVMIDAFYYCPHYVKGIVPEYAVPCQCRKPAVGMVEEAIHQMHINPRISYVIGDKLSDVHLGKFIGGKSILVRTGYGREEEKIIQKSLVYQDVLIVDSIREAADAITKGL